MKTIVYSLVSMLCFAGSNVLLEQKLAKFNNLTIMVCYSFTILVLASIVRLFVKTDDPSFNFPTGTNIFLMLLMAGIFFAGDYFYIGAFTTGGNLLTIASIVMMYPVFASLIRLIWVREVPNLYHIGGYILALCAILLVTRGNMLLNAPK